MDAGRLWVLLVTVQALTVDKPLADNPAGKMVLNSTLLSFASLLCRVVRRETRRGMANQCEKVRESDDERYANAPPLRRGVEHVMIAFMT